MTFRASIPPLLITAVVAMLSCKTLVFGSSDYDVVSESRAGEQTNFEDSARVFFTTYTNPYPDKEFMWFAVFREGPVEMHVHNIETDSLECVYHFEKQDFPVHTVALHADQERLVKCVLFVDGRAKCAKLYPSWRPIQIPQFKTQYTIESR